ncbi:MAG: FecR family protein [Candidatus Omnitrophica bacterium]|nr:FecR family protein [Candidatus Omnitrophota bacterium]
MKPKIFNIKILIMGCAVFLFFCVPLLAGEDTATLKAMIGTVEYFSKGATGWQAATEGLKLSSGDKIKTGGDGMVSIDFANGGRIFLKPDTEFEITSLNRSDDKGSIDYKLQLNMGRLRAAVEKLDPNSSFEIKTPTAVAAIRGTTYYLTVREAKADEIPADVKERLTTDLFVEGGGVLYTSIVSGKYFVVNSSQTATSYGDGAVTIPIEVPPDRQLEWTQGWELLVVEPYESADGETLADLFSNEAGGENDPRLGDKVSELAAAAVELYDERDIIWQEMRNKLLEREYLRSSIYEILDGNRERRLEGYIEKISDAQMGKVLKDIHGNRVRMEQYILRPSSNTVELLNVNLRGTNDLTTMEWVTNFNTSLDNLPTGQLKTLPWNSYLSTQYVAGIPMYIQSPDQPSGIYPAGMSIKFSHNSDAFQESRRFSDRNVSLRTQGITDQRLWVSNFNDGNAMAYFPSAGSYQPPGTYSIQSDRRNADDEDGGGIGSNPKGFQYNFASLSGYGSIGAAFYIISDGGVKQDGSSLKMNDIWDALRVNLPGSGKHQIGDNNLEMIFSSAQFQDGTIDLIYVPMMSMEWQDETYVPFPAESPQ